MIDIINLIANIASIIGVFIGIYAIFYASKIDKRGQVSFERINSQFVATDTTLEKINNQLAVTFEKINSQFVATDTALERINNQFAVTDTTLRLTGPAPQLFISQCKRDAKAKGFLDYELQPEKHYIINQEGRKFLNDLDETLQERIGQVIDQIRYEQGIQPPAPFNKGESVQTTTRDKAQIDDALLILYLDVKQLYDLINQYNQQKGKDYSINVAIGTIIAFAYGGWVKL
jgi:hypothetical protein